MVLRTQVAFLLALLAVAHTGLLAAPASAIGFVNTEGLPVPTSLAADLRPPANLAPDPRDDIDITSRADALGNSQNASVNINETSLYEYEDVKVLFTVWDLRPLTDYYIAYQATSAGQEIIQSATSDAQGRFSVNVHIDNTGPSSGVTGNLACIHAFDQAGLEMARRFLEISTTASPGTATEEVIPAALVGGVNMRTGRSGTSGNGFGRTHVESLGGWQGTQVRGKTIETLANPDPGYPMPEPKNPSTGLRYEKNGWRVVVETAKDKVDGSMIGIITAYLPPPPMPIVEVTDTCPPDCATDTEIYRKDRYAVRENSGPFMAVAVDCDFNIVGTCVAFPYEWHMASTNDLHVSCAANSHCAPFVTPPQVPNKSTLCQMGLGVLRTAS